MLIDVYEKSLGKNEAMCISMHRLTGAKMTKKKLNRTHLDKIPKLVPLVKPPKKPMRLHPNEYGLIHTSQIAESDRVICLLNALDELYPDYITQSAKKMIREHIDKIMEILMQYQRLEQEKSKK